jgi:hypothetical protein
MLTSIWPFMRKTDKWPKKMFFCPLQCALFNSFRLFLKSNQEVRMGYLDSMKIVSRGKWEGIMQWFSIMCKCRISFYCIIINATSTHFAAKKPSKGPPFRLDGKTKDHVLMKFPAVRSDSRLTRRCSMFKKQNKKLVKLGGIVESVVFLCILGKVIPGTTLSKCTKKDLQKVCTNFQLPMCHRLRAESFCILLVSECIKCTLIFKNPGFGI